MLRVHFKFSLLMLVASTCMTAMIAAEEMNGVVPAGGHVIHAPGGAWVACGPTGGHFGHGHLAGLGGGQLAGLGGGQLGGRIGAGIHGDVTGACRQYQYGSPDLFYNFYSPTNCGGHLSGIYPAPLPVPLHVGHVYYTYQPLMPHEFLYKHHRSYHRYYNDGRGLTRTSVHWW